VMGELAKHPRGLGGPLWGFTLSDTWVFGRWSSGAQCSPCLGGRCRRLKPSCDDHQIHAVVGLISHPFPTRKESEGGRSPLCRHAAQEVPGDAACWAGGWCQLGTSECVNSYLQLVPSLSAAVMTTATGLQALCASCSHPS
jgi:hypothetical protein